MKYILTTESANFGNMLSMAVASMVLPFLPLLAPQVLLNNFLSDIPAMTLARDRVDPEMVQRPQRWDLPFIRRFMVVFGLVSSVFDAITFVTLAVLFRATPSTFRTGWFMESLLTELLVALIVRTRRSFWMSRPGKWLALSTGVVGIIALVLPYLPFATRFEFIPLSAPMLLALIGITVGYVLTVEALKHRLFATIVERSRTNRAT